MRATVDAVEVGLRNHFDSIGVHRHESDDRVVSLGRQSQIEVR